MATPLKKQKKNLQNKLALKGIKPPLEAVFCYHIAMSGIVGIDEVGRGSWAGPLLVVAAKATSDLPDELKDSKLLIKSKREALFEVIKESCALGEGWVQPEEIDQHGLAEAMRIGVSRALLALGASFDDEIILDGNVNYCPDEFVRAKCQIKADNLIPIVSAASIVAKVARDNYMADMAKKFPNYGFEKHVGYGTALHTQALKLHGVTLLHRKSYKPIQAFII
jgi:ribonuclease HII